jgi:hypothetical protein
MSGLFFESADLLMDGLPRLKLPEVVGLAVVGATVGAVLAGAGSRDLSLLGVVAALAGGALPFGLLLLPR